MKEECILSIAVPTYNMENCLEKNLNTYDDERLNGKIEVLILNNASKDKSGEIAEKFCKRNPKIYKLINRKTRGYGSSINEAIEKAKGTYFRIIDADDWVDTNELVFFVEALERCTSDVAYTNYELVEMCTGRTRYMEAKGVEYYKEYRDLEKPKETLPSIHGTSYRTGVLRKSGFKMQDEMYFVDEEYVILPYLFVNSVIYYPFDVYRYQILNPGQSTSPKNRAKFLKDRENVLKRLISEFCSAEDEGGYSISSLQYCYERIVRGVGDHFTTLYMYVENRGEGKRLAAQWKMYLKSLRKRDFYLETKTKSSLLRILNFLNVSLDNYEKLKKLLGGQQK